MIGAALSAGSLLSTGATAQTGSRNGKLSPGDVALLQFALCAELVESDLWTQYAELGGVGRSRLAYTISKRREPGRRRGILGTVRDSKPAGDTAGRFGYAPHPNSTIPITGRDAQRIQAIANTAGFHSHLSSREARVSIRPSHLRRG